MSKKLLGEIVEQIRESLPNGTNLHDWINDANRFAITEDLSQISGEALFYQYGRLLGVSEWADTPILELLEDYEVPLFIDEPESNPCLVRSEYCAVHGVVHGAEAEELRKGVEVLIGNYEPVPGELLQELLDRVSAADSLAYLDAQDDTESTNTEKVE